MILKCEAKQPLGCLDSASSAAADSLGTLGRSTLQSPPYPPHPAPLPTTTTHTPLRLLEGRNGFPPRQCHEI